MKQLQKSKMEEKQEISLMSAVISGDLDAVHRLINQADQSGSNFAGVDQWEHVALNQCIGKSMQIASENRVKITPLMAALAYGHVEIVKMLVACESCNYLQETDGPDQRSVWDFAIDGTKSNPNKNMVRIFYKAAQKRVPTCKILSEKHKRLLIPMTEKAAEAFKRKDIIKYDLDHLFVSNYGEIFSPIILYDALNIVATYGSVNCLKKLVEMEVDAADYVRTLYLSAKKWQDILC